jgi:hypothetical protein
MFTLISAASIASAFDCARCEDDVELSCIEKSFDSDEAKCRKALSKNVGKVQKTAAKVSASCHKDRNSTKRDVGDDCNDMAVADAPKAKLAKAQTKFVNAMAKSCPASIGDGVLDEYISCSESCNAQLAPLIGNPIATYDDLARCLGCMAADAVAARNVSVLGNPSAPLASKDDQKCHQQLSKSYDKYVQTIVKNRSKCQDKAEAKAGACGLTDTTCLTDDDKGKIAGSLAKAAAGVSKKCGIADFSQFNLAGSCSVAVDPASYNACAGPLSEQVGGTTLVDTYSRGDEGICPIRIDTNIRGGYGKLCAHNSDCAPVQVCAPAGAVDRCQTATRLDVGWTGEAHDVDTTDNYTLSANVSCPEEGRCSDDQGVSCTTNGDCAGICIQADPCGNCSIDGVAMNGPQYTDFTRCEADTAIPCTMPFQLDGACGGALCGAYVGPPLPMNAALSPLCSLLRVETDVTGTANPDDGSSTFLSNLVSKVHFGITQTLPCPTCVGDIVAADGVKDGECNYGSPIDPDPHNGAPCDAQGFQGTFANESDGVALSLDCPPTQDKNISGVGLRIPINFTTGTASLPFETNCDPPFPPPPAFVCACGVCSLDTLKGCVNNADCDLGSEGTCTTNGGGQAAARQPNQCSDLVCSSVSGGRGECGGGGVGDTIKYCDAELRASGEGYLNCTNNIDCAAFASICGGDNCGNCTLEKTRPCFVDPIEFVGSPDLDDPILAGTFCLPPTNNNAINVWYGLPGPGRVRTSTVVNSVYK